MAGSDRNHAGRLHEELTGSDAGPPAGSGWRSSLNLDRTRDEPGGDVSATPAPFGDFRLLSDLGDNLAVARWQAGHFDCDPELLDRASVVTALGEVVGSEHDHPGMAATTSPSEPLALLLTLIRSARVVYCRVNLAAPASGRSGSFTLTMTAGRGGAQIG